MDKELYVIGDAKTCDDIDNEHTRNQLKAWTNLAMSTGKSKGVRIPVHLIVPSVCKNALETLLANMGLKERVTIWS